MTGVIVTGHGNFATGILSTLKLIVGEQEAVWGVDFPESHSIDNLRDNLLAVLSNGADGYLILSDLEGGSPYNTSVKLMVECTDKNIQVLAGANFSMLVTAALQREGVTLSELTEEVLKAGHDGIVEFKLAAPKAAEPDGEEDGI